MPVASRRVEVLTTVRRVCRPRRWTGRVALLLAAAVAIAACGGDDEDLEEQIAALERGNAELREQIAGLQAEIDFAASAVPEAGSRLPSHAPGTARPLFQLPGPGLSVVALGTVERQSFATVMPIAAWNNTTETVVAVTVAVAARDKAGSLLGAGSTRIMVPHNVEPGEVAYGEVFFLDPQFPADAKFTFSLDASTIEQISNPHAKDLTVEEYRLDGNRLVGTLANPHAEPQGAIVVMVPCFTAEGDYQSLHQGRALIDPMPSLGRSPFFVAVEDCQTFWCSPSAPPTVDPMPPASPRAVPASTGRRAVAARPAEPVVPSPAEAEVALTTLWVPTTSSIFMAVSHPHGARDRLAGALRVA